MKEKFNKTGQNIRPLLTDGRVVGRACIQSTDARNYYTNPIPGIVSVGGFRACTLNYHIAGILEGTSVTAARDVAIPNVDDTTLRRWASEQSDLIRHMTREPQELYQCAFIIRAFAGRLSDLPVARSRNGWLTTEQLRSLASSRDQFLIISDETLQEKVDNRLDRLLDGVLVTRPGQPTFIASIRQPVPVSWPRHDRNTNPERFHDRSLEGAVIEALAAGWSAPLQRVFDASSINWDQSILDNLPQRPMIYITDDISVSEVQSSVNQLRTFSIVRRPS